MNLEEKNEIIVEKLRNLINNNPSLYQEIEKELGNVLPDLFLSKDEKTLNDIVNFLAKPSRQTITTLSEWADWLEDKNECVEKEAAERLGEEEMIALAAGHLTKKQLVVFIYMYIYRLNGRMCADMMHITPSAVSQILSAIKRRLRCTPF